MDGDDALQVADEHVGVPLLRQAAAGEHSGCVPATVEEAYGVVHELALAGSSLVARLAEIAGRSPEVLLDMTVLAMCPDADSFNDSDGGG